MTQDEVQFMYKSNLSKYTEDDWLFTTTNTCLADDSSYSYTGYAISSEWAVYATGRTVTTDIPNFGFTGMIDFDFGNLAVTNAEQTVTGQMWSYVEVSDWIANTWFSTSIQSSLNMVWQTHWKIVSWENFYFKSDVLTYRSGWVSDDVYMANLIQTEKNIHSLPEDYIMKAHNPDDFMCNGWVYGDDPHLKMVVPAYLNPDVYIGNLYIDSMQE